MKEIEDMNREELKQFTEGEKYDKLNEEEKERVSERLDWLNIETLIKKHGRDLLLAKLLWDLEISVSVLRQRVCSIDMELERLKENMPDKEYYERIMTIMRGLAAKLAFR